MLTQEYKETNVQTLLRISKPNYVMRRIIDQLGFTLGFLRWATTTTTTPNTYTMDSLRRMTDGG